MVVIVNHPVSPLWQFVITAEIARRSTESDDAVQRAFASLLAEGIR